jgi:beta-glucuronidase
MRRNEMAEQNIFLSHIHDEGYMAPYRTKTAVAASLLTTDRPGTTERLDGVWSFRADPYDTSVRAKWFEVPLRDDSGALIPWDFDFDQWEEMVLPATWNVQEEYLYYYEHSVVFTRTFLYEKGPEARTMIRFGACAYAATVFLNGSYVGNHDGSSTPFVLDVTAAIEAENRIMVILENTRSRNRVPMSNTDWFNYGGIHRSIELLRLPEAYVQHCFVGLIPRSGYKKLFCEVTVSTGAAGAQRSGASADLPPEAVLEIPEHSLTAKVPLQEGKGRVEIDASPELWTPENPRLYDLTLRSGEDLVVDRVGFREIRREGNEILLNGESIFLRGVSMHEESVFNGRTLSEAEIRENFSLVKELGGNFARLAHYPHNGLASKVADEVGLLLWEEVPVYWAINFDSEEAYADAENQLSELILRDRNRASVAIWSVGNENPDTDARLSFMSNLAKRARELDGTRLVSAACLVDHVANRIADRLTEHLDVIGLNEYFGWYEPDFGKFPDLLENSKPDKPVIVTEFGGGALAGNHGSRDEMFTEENQEWIYLRQTATIETIPYIKGMSPWILYDFRTPKRANRFQQGYNRKGLLSEDKSYRKLAFYVLQEFYQKLSRR